MSSIKGRQKPGAEIMPSVQNKQQRADYYKGLEATLHDPKKKYQEKVNALLSAWERVVFLTDKSPDHVDELTENIHRDTFHIVLQGEWPGLAAATKTHLLHILSRCAASKHPCAPNYKSIIEIVKEPWGHSTLKRIIAGEELSIEEVTSYCNSESSTLLNMRLQILTSSKCEDFALRLARICVRCLKIPGSRLHEECSTEHKNELIDFYVALLYKFKLYTEIIEEVLMGMTLEEGMDLARRHVDNGLGPSTSRLWKHSITIGLLEVRFFLKVAVKQTETTCSDTLIQLALMWGALHQKAKTSYESLAEQIKGLVHQSDDTGHVYIICSSLHELLGDDFRALFIELIIHGLTTDMNDLEKQKLVNMNVKAGEAARRISLGFEHLSKLFVNNVGVSRECILNAFSLYPTKELYAKLKELAVICGKAVPPEQSNEERCISVDELCKNCKNYENNSSNENNAENAASSPNVNSVSDSTLICVSVAHSSENKNNISCDNTAPPNMAMRPNSPIASCSKSQESNFPCQGIVCSKCGTITVANTSGSSGNTPGNAITEPLNYDIMSSNQVFDAQRLGVSSDVCDDLAVILGCPRWQLLSWNLEWNELSSLCEKYLNDPEGTRSVIKELKYLDIDYDQFKNYPTVEIDEYYGIEKGYEHLLNYEQYGEEEEDESEIPKPKGRRKAVDSDFEDYVPNQKKKKNVLVDTSNSKAGLTVIKTKQTGVRGRKKQVTTGRGRGKCGMRGLKYKNMRGSNTGKTLEVPPFNNGASLGSRCKSPGTVGRGRGRGRGRDGRSAFQSNIEPEFEVEQNGVLGNKTGDPEILKTLLMFTPVNCNSSNKNVSDSIINDASSSDKQCNGFQMEDPHILPPQSPVSKNEATVNDPHNIFSAIPTTTLTKLPIGAVKSLIHGSPGRLLIAQAVPQRLPQNLNQASTSGLGQMAQQVTLPGFRAAPAGTRLQVTILTSSTQATPEEVARMHQDVTKVLMRAKESAAQAAQAAKTAQANKTAAATATSPNVANRAARMVSVGTTTNSPSITKSGIDAIDSSSEESTDSGSPAVNHLTSNSIPNLVSAVPTPAQRAAVQTDIIRRIPLPLDGNNRLLRTRGSHRGEDLDVLKVGSADENVLGDDEGGDMDESTQESQTQERKSVPVACSSDSNWSASPDISESSPLSVDMKSGGECGQRTSSRRSSQRSKVQRSTCSCCNGSPEPKKSRNA